MVILGPNISILSQIVKSLGIAFFTKLFSLSNESFIYLLSSGIYKLIKPTPKFILQFLNELRLSVCNKVYICKDAIPVIAAVVEAIAGIIFPAISLTFKKS